MWQMYDCEKLSNYNAINKFMEIKKNKKPWLDLIVLTKVIFIVTLILYVACTRTG